LAAQRSRIEKLVARQQALVAAQQAAERQRAAAQATAEMPTSERRVSFGAVPDFAYAGPGVRLQGVTPGSPAAGAGLEAGDVIVRLYEAARTATRCRLTTKLPVCMVMEADMLERSGRQLPGGTAVPLDFRPFEIKTLRLRLTSG
ncbi:MAG: hypothetical protein K6U03_11765, partial [Firmicutes bacterium]|nr:hypothetical protein [Bacillota bacterium]